MDTYEQEFPVKRKKQSPYADSVYESAYVEQENPQPQKKTKNKRDLRWLKNVLILVMMLIGCVGTAIGVSAVWQGRVERLEAAVDDKYAVLEQMYAQAQKSLFRADTNGMMLPGQVYAENIDAVVAVDALIETEAGYGENMGSGFIISSDGYVVTNHHVINGATEVVVITHGGDVLAAQIIGSDAASDVALLKINEKDQYPYVTLGSSDTVLVGEQVAAIGSPLGELTSTLTVGYISAKDRVVSTDGSEMNMLQTDAAINSGNSGGPLFNMYGEVIGIITSKYSGNSSSGASIEGLGFAIPVDDVQRILSDLKEFGYVTGAYLGVYVRDVDINAQYYGLPAGAYVEEVMTGLSAARGGLRAGDIIVNLGGYDIGSVSELTRVLRRFEAGETTSITVFRDGQRVYLQVTLDEKPVATQTPEQEPENEMPQEGNFEDWFNYFAPYFGFDFGD